MKNLWLRKTTRTMRTLRPLLNGALLIGTALRVWAIPCLLRSRGPAAILGRVRTVVVDTIQCETLRPAPHIREKLREIIPSFANLNSARAVGCITFYARIVATRFHVCPNRVFRRAPASMSEYTVAGDLRMQTSTGLRKATSQALPSNDYGFPAIASTTPTCIGSSRYQLKSDESPKPHICKVQYWHSALIKAQNFTAIQAQV